MSGKLGSTNIWDIYKQSSIIDSVYLGTTKVYDINDKKEYGILRNIRKTYEKIKGIAQKYDIDISLEILNDAAHFVSRAAHKLEGALQAFGIDLLRL